MGGTAGRDRAGCIGPEPGYRASEIPIVAAASRMVPAGSDVRSCAYNENVPYNQMTETAPFDVYVDCIDKPV